MLINKKNKAYIATRTIVRTFKEVETSRFMAESEEEVKKLIGEGYDMVNRGCSGKTISEDITINIEEDND